MSQQTSLKMGWKVKYFRLCRPKGCSKIKDIQDQKPASAQIKNSDIMKNDQFFHFISPYLKNSFKYFISTAE
jgi:hypothetical protein